MTDTARRVELITRYCEEVIGADELPALLEQGMPLRHYIGLEISGRLHLGTGLMVMQKVRDLQMAGVQCTIFLADWHTWLNDKLGGDRQAIKQIAGGYFKEGLKASLAALGGDPDNLEFVLGSDLYHDNDQYWETLVEVCKNTSLNRIERSISIMGRSEGESVDFAKLLYPPMQVADVFMLRVNIAQGGMDQRKAHVIVRDVAKSLKICPLTDAKGNVIKPVAIHHHLLLGLSKPPEWPVDPEKLRELRTQMKMSKSKPDSAVFIHDSPDEIRRKIRKAFCPPETDFNPVLDWAEHLIFHNNEQGLHVERTPENGGNVDFATFEELRDTYAAGKLHPGDLKNAVAQSLIDMLEPVRKRFEQDDLKAMWSDLEKLL
ncbi:MAG TPA: tyrosine--tRNA ligase [Aggregatilineales bacterium]|nr:tyrosine--tRNA ligase [Aggregatilineales bacterium]